MTFDKLNIIEPVLKALKEKEYSVPTPIQQEAIPVALEKQDLLGLAQTGTGKTAAFAIPIIQHLYNEARQEKKKNKEIKALVLTPTRELAIQIEESFRDYAKYTSLRHCVIFGGVKQKAQTDELRKGVDILIATPGRLLDLVAQGFVSLDAIRYFVLDEADRMLDMGFIHDIKRILPKLPVKRQTLFFSATMPPAISSLSRSILKNPRRVEVTPVSSIVETIEQYLYYVEKQEKKDLLIKLLAEKEEASSVLVFSRTKHGADKIARILCKAGIGSEAIHGNKSQNARQKALSNFKSHKTRVLIATDIAARGIDVNQLETVINYDLPDVPETYVHRIGRTGRAGNSGKAYTFCSQDERPMLKDIQKLTGRVLRPLNAGIGEMSGL
ncbi:DEAD/DEAH box helicase [Barnesiella propionica]|uniref:DEAD/DEAH box helicase n=1 Tax=Barnesiella propionica TaxID=2981781 RepID=UPI0011CB597E|nr:DEAD/DEAH box helicase [Barnesiella propionica]MCU6767868.1 DEAD/DEAH box helicase [Barnesiella propionica]